MTVSHQQNREDFARIAEKILAGEDLFNAGDTDHAILAFNDVLSIDPGNATAHSNLGVVYWQLGEEEKALHHLSAAYEADPEDSTVIRNLAEVYAATSQPDEIIRICTAYLEKYPASTEIRDMMNHLVGVVRCVASGSGDLGAELLSQAETMFSRGEMQRSLAVLQAVLAVSGSSVRIFRAHCLLGDIYRQSGQTAKAIHHLMEAFRIDSHHRGTVLELARLLLELQRHDTAEHVLGTYLYLHSDDRQAAELMEITTRELEKNRRLAVTQDSTGGDEEQNLSQVSLVERIPEMNDTLRVLLRLGVEINSILDVGVLHGTHALMQNFPTLTHYLFEPIDDHFDTIKNNYAEFDFELHHVALSNSDGEAWQNGICIDASGRITHSKIGDEPLTREQDSRLISTKRVKKARLDSLVPGLRAATPYLLKIDVDGHEIPILEGSVDTLKNASVVVIEATRRTLLNRAQLLADSGFLLFDIVDFAYYSGVLSQVDLVFVRKDIVEGDDKLRPIEIRPFKPGQWYPLSTRCFGR